MKWCYVWDKIWNCMWKVPVDFVLHNVVWFDFFLRWCVVMHLYGLVSNHRIDRKRFEYSRAIIHDENLFAEALFSIFGTHAHIVAIIHFVFSSDQLVVVVIVAVNFPVSHPFLLSRFRGSVLWWKSICIRKLLAIYAFRTPWIWTTSEQSLTLHGAHCTHTHRAQARSLSTLSNPL